MRLERSCLYHNFIHLYVPLSRYHNFNPQIDQLFFSMEKLFTQSKFLAGRFSWLLLMALVLSLVIGNSANGQVLLSEGFESTTFPPTGWTSSIVSGSYNWAR